MLFTVMGWKLKYSAQESDLAPFVGNGTKVKIYSEIKLPLNNGATGNPTPFSLSGKTNIGARFLHLLNNQTFPQRTQIPQNLQPK